MSIAKMKNKTFAVMGIGLMLLAACGRIDDGFRPGKMTKEEAVDTLKNIPSTPSTSSGSPTNNVSVAGLQGLIQGLVSSGQVEVPSSARGLTTSTGGGVDLTQLINLISLFQSGQGLSLGSIAQTLIGLNGGNAGATSGGLSGIVALLQSLLPIILSIAPQFAPIIQAVLVIAPIVIGFIGLFSRPKTRKPKPTPTPTPTASLLDVQWMVA